MRVPNSRKALFLAVVIALGSWLMAYPSGVAEEAESQARESKATAEQGVVELSLEEAIQTALEKNLALAQARHGARAVLFQERAIRAALMPKLDLENMSSIVDDSNLDIPPFLQAQGGGGQIFGQDKYTRLTTLSLTQPISFTLPKVLSSLSHARRAADLQVSALEDQIRFATTQAYLMALLAEEKLRVAEEGLRLAEKLRRAAKVRYEVGTAPRFDLIQAEVGVANARQELEKARAERERALRNLLLVMGVEGVSADHLRLSQRPLEDEGGLADGFRPDDLPGYPDRYLALNATYLALRETAKAARIKAGALRLIPEFALIASARDMDQSPFQSGEIYSLGLSARWRIFDSGEVRSKRLSAREEAAAAQAKAEEFRRNLREDLIWAADQVRVSRLNLATAKEALRQAREALRMAELGYREGETSLIEYDQAKVAYLSAQVRLYATRVELALAVERIRSLIGYRNLPQKEEGSGTKTESG